MKIEKKSHTKVTGKMAYWEINFTQIRTMEHLRLQKGTSFPVKYFLCFV